jgi:3-oxoacyl-[acyl-carrier-protein] synthase III
MGKQPRARIIGIGTYLPAKVLTNQDFERMVETSDEWIVSRTGIKERRIAEKNEMTSDMGAAAAKIATENAGINAQDIDLVLVATMTPDYVSSSTAAIIQHLIGATHAAAFDLQAACTGFIYGLATAKAYIEAGMYENILLVAPEKMSTYVNYKDRSTSILFGDGAAAVVISGKGKGLAIENVCLGSDGELADLIIVPAGGARNPPSLETIEKGLHYFQMNGKEVFKHAVRRMSAAARESLSKAGLKEEDVSWLVPHQANLRIMDAIAKGFNIPHEKMYKTVQKYGNTSASSVAIALEELTKQHKIEIGEHLLLVAFGAGLTWGASVLTQVNS